MLAWTNDKRYKPGAWAAESSVTVGLKGHENVASGVLRENLASIEMCIWL